MSYMYGQMAQAVSPNPKCNSCWHYNSQRGSDGICEIGLRPITCGDGDMPSIGYAPVSAIGPDVAGTHAPNGQAPIQPGRDLVPASALYRNNNGNGGTVAMQIVTLGEEHAELVKSLEQELSVICRFHDKTSHATPHAAALQSFDSCTCRAPSDRRLSKALTSKMSRGMLARLGENYDDLVSTFVESVRKGQDINDVHKSMANTAVTKGFYNQEWIDQFKGTPLFDQALKLCKKELTLTAENIKRRSDSAKRRKEREAHLAKLTPEPSYNYDEEYAKEEQLRLEKQKLQLKLAEHQQKQLSSTKMIKSEKQLNKR